MSNVSHHLRALVKLYQLIPCEEDTVGYGNTHSDERCFSYQFDKETLALK